MSKTFHLDFRCQVFDNIILLCILISTAGEPRDPEKWMVRRRSFPFWNGPFSGDICSFSREPKAYVYPTIYNYIRGSITRRMGWFGRVNEFLTENRHFKPASSLAQGTSYFGLPCCFDFCDWNMPGTARYVYQWIYLLYNYNRIQDSTFTEATYMNVYGETSEFGHPEIHSQSQLESWNRRA